MNRVLAYDPRDLTLGVEPGVRIEDCCASLRSRSNFCRWRFRSRTARRSAGSWPRMRSSPLRHAYGGVRDFCLGMEFVTGEGIAAKSGGRVVKNVTGYDLHKLLIGSLGTLAVITRVNFRTFPLPPAQGRLSRHFPTPKRRFDFCRAIAQSVLTPQIVEIADPGAARLLFSANAPARIDAAAVVRGHLRGRARCRRGAPRARTRPHGEQPRTPTNLCALERCGSVVRFCSHSRISAARSWKPRRRRRFFALRVVPTAMAAPAAAADELASAESS